MKRSTRFVKVFLVLMACFSIFGCNKEFENLTKTYPNDSTQNGKGKTKVLLLVVDGVRGEMLNYLDPVNFRLMAKNALYCNNSLGDFINKDYSRETGYANIFTGVTSLKSEVNDADLSKWDEKKYPTFISRLKNEVPNFNSIAFVSDSKLTSSFLKDINKNEVLTTDDAILDKTITNIQENDEVNLIVSQLKNPADVGKANTFESSDKNYQQAIMKLDNQIGQLLDAIRSRPNHKNENWLMVVTSSIGGKTVEIDPLDPTKYADPERDIFTYFYSPLFSKETVIKPVTSPFNFTVNVMLTNYASSAFAAVYYLRNTNAINFPADSSFTINFFVKHQNAPSEEVTIIRKRGNANPFSRGWQTTATPESTVRFRATGLNAYIETPKINDAQWHVVTITVNRTTKKVAIYLDGILSNQQNIADLDLLNNEPLLIGKVHTSLNKLDYGYYYNFEHHSGSLSYCNFQIYDFPMTQEDIDTYAGLTTLNTDVTPYFTNLLGYWPTYDDNNGSKSLTDVSGNGLGMASVNAVSFAQEQLKSDFIQTVVPVSKYKVVPNLVDLAPFIFQWFGVLPSNHWELDGQTWQPPYLILEY